MDSSISCAPERPFVLGITGASGSGKSSLALVLANRFGGVLFPEDPRFFKGAATESYKDRDPASETPQHVNWDLYIESLLHKIEASRGKRLLVVEHFLLLHHGRVLRELNGLVFLDPEGKQVEEHEAMKICMMRRVNRNPGRSLEEVEHLCRYYQRHVWPNYKKYCSSHAMEYCANNSKRSLRVEGCQKSANDIADLVETCVNDWVKEKSVDP